MSHLDVRFITVLNHIGIERVKWVQNIGGVAIWACVALLLVAGITYFIRHGSVHSTSVRNFIPDLRNIELLPFIALVPFCYGGLELAPVMAGEIRSPRRNIPRAILFASIIVGLVYILGTFGVLVILPEGDIDPIAGVAQAFSAFSGIFSIPVFEAVGALLIVLATLGLVGAWMTGNARVPFVIGLDHYLPDAFARVHPKYGSPVVSLYMQAIVISILFIASIAGSTVEEAFFTLLEMSVILYFIPFLYLFAAFAKHVSKGAGAAGLFPVFARAKGTMWLVAGLGFVTTLVGTVMSCLPTASIADKTFFIVKVVGGAVLLLAVGLVVYFRKKWGGRMNSE